MEDQDEDTGERPSSARKKNPRANLPSADSAGESTAEKLQDAVRSLEEPPRSERQLPLLSKDGSDNGRPLITTAPAVGKIWEPNLPTRLFPREPNPAGSLRLFCRHLLGRWSRARPR